MEELEMKIREEYYKGNENVSAESFSNEAFGVSLDVLQASILKCPCVHCAAIKAIRRDLDEVHIETYYGSPKIGKQKKNKCMIKVTFCQNKAESRSERINKYINLLVWKVAAHSNYMAAHSDDVAAHSDVWLLT